MFGMNKRQLNEMLAEALMTRDNNNIQNALNMGADPNAIVNDESALSFALNYRSESVALSLLKAGADPNRADTRGERPLDLAIKKCSQDLIKSLVEKGAKLEGSAALCAATKSLPASVLSFLLEQGADPCEPHRYDSQTPPLLAAIKAGNTEAVQILLPYIKDLEKPMAAPAERPLIHALAHGADEIAQILIASGVDVKTPSTESIPVMVLAARHAPESFLDLLRKGESVDAKTVNEETLLHLAAKAGYKKVAAALLDRGLDVNAQDEQGRTPLHLAVEQGHREIVGLLLEKNADVALTDGNGLTPFALAVRLQKASIQKIFKEHHAGHILLDQDQVAKISVLDGVKREITDIFNFKTRERIRIVVNLDNKQESHSSESFDRLARTQGLQEAFAMFTRLGGKVDPAVIEPGYQPRSGIKKLPQNGTD